MLCVETGDIIFGFLVVSFFFFVLFLSFVLYRFSVLYALYCLLSLVGVRDRGLCGGMNGGNDTYAINALTLLSYYCYQFIQLVG